MVHHFSGGCTHVFLGGQNLRERSVTPEGNRHKHQLAHQIRMADSRLQGNPADEQVTRQIRPW
jgi:hypothetical protein